MEATMDRLDPIAKTSRSDRLLEILEFAAAIVTLLGIGYAALSVLGIAQDVLLGNELIKPAIDECSVPFGKALRVLNTGLAYATGEK